MTTDRSVILYHVTLNQSVPSIKRYGLLAAKAQRRRKAVWLVTKSNIKWAIDHLCDRGYYASQLTIIAVRVRRRNLRKQGGYNRGIWYHTGDIYPQQFVDVYQDAYQFYLEYLA